MNDAYLAHAQPTATNPQPPNPHRPLPPNKQQAVSMNDSYLADDDYSGVQPVEDIRALLSEAQTPGPSKYNFQEEGGDDYGDMIDAAIGEGARGARGGGLAAAAGAAAGAAGARRRRRGLGARPGGGGPRGGRGRAGGGAGPAWGSRRARAARGRAGRGRGPQRRRAAVPRLPALGGARLQRAAPCPCRRRRRRVPGQRAQLRPPGALRGRPVCVRVRACARARVRVCVL
jgi:hypothetical protein